MRTLIIGAGPAGMMAAITAAKCGDQVTVIEHMQIPGKKILSTGNGRCNLTNRIQKDNFYHTETPHFYKKALTGFDYSDTLKFFRSLGIMTREKEGYFYPRSMQASSVRDALEEKMNKLHIDLRTEEHVTEIIPDFKNGFLAKTKTTSFYAERVILACGGMAAPVLGSDGSGLTIAKKLGHNIIDPVPALTGMKAKNSPFRKASGVRCQACVSFTDHNGQKISDSGELQITDYGISGIPVFQICYAVGRELLNGFSASVVLDFLPECSDEDARDLLYKLCSGEERTILSCLNGLFPDKLSVCLLKAAGIPSHLSCLQIANDRKRLRKLTDCICSFKTEITETNDFSKAQVTSGGVDCSEIDPETMESLIVPGLYFAGEIMDVDGICGGYNLQWAWSSGYAAGRCGRKTEIGDTYI